MPKTPLDHLEADTKPKTKVTSVMLDGREIDVLPVMKWKASGLRALKDNDIDGWAEKCLTPEAYAIWCEIDPDLEQCEQFFNAWGEQTGENRPK